LAAALFAALPNVLRVHSRAMDTAARYGGGRICRGVTGSQRGSGEFGQPAHCERLAKDGEFPQVAVSVGAAVFPRDGEND